MLFKVTYTCGHVGIASAASLPRELVCWSCGAVRRVEPNGDARIVSTERRIENIDHILARATR